MSSERDRRRGASPSRGPPRGSRGPSTPPRGGRGPPDRGGYKVLCVSSLHPKSSDDVVRDTLHREYKKYGDISVRVMHEPDERVAYVYFRNFEDARDAKHSKSRIILFDKVAAVEAVYESASREEYEGGGGGGGRGARAARGRGRERSLTPPRYGGRGDGPRDYGRPRSPIDRYDGGFRDDYRRGPPRGGHRDDYRGPPRGGHRDDFRGPPRGYRGRGYDRGPPQYDSYGGRGGGGGDRGGFRGGDSFRENKKDKFPNYLNHLDPEDDPLATKTLFAGNLELNITEEEMRHIFGRYGELVDIDIKRPPPGTGNAYAFIKFANLDQASLAKKELSGQYVGKFQCKIGYGKVNATTKVWVGGLGPWCSNSDLEREFDRFGAIQKIDFDKDNDFAFIQYETIDAATAAVSEMRGFPLGGPDKRLRMDFADVEEGPEGATPRGYQGSDYDPNIARGRGGGRGGFRGARGGRGGFFEGGRDEFGKRGRDFDEGEPGSKMRRVASPENGHETSNGDGVSASKSVADLSKRLDKTWEGGLILKNSMFPTRFLLTEGDGTVEALMKDENEKPYMKITQRLRMDQGKLDDVSARINSSSSHAIFLAVAASSATVPVAEGQTEIQSRPLRNLVSYLKQKEAAGVISLHLKEASGVLYCFPPSEFSTELLRRVAAELTDEGNKDDYLVVVVVRGGQTITNN